MAEIVRQQAATAPVGEPAARDGDRAAPRRRLGRRGARRADGKSARAGGGKKRRLRLFILIGAIVLALAVAAMVFLTVRFDLWGIRSAFIGAVSSLDPEYVSAIEQKRINARDAADLDRRGAELDEREAGIAEEEERLRALGEELDEREKALASAAPPSTSGSGRPQGGYRTSLGAQETEDMMSLARTYAAMDPVAAAEIMANLYSVNDMAVILYYMTEKRAAPILEAMERELAASVTEVLLAEAGRVFN